MLNSNHQNSTRNYNNSVFNKHYGFWKCIYFWWKVESSWNVMAYGDAREGKWRGNWRMEWVASTLHTTSEHGASSITTAGVHTSATSSRLNWRFRRFKWTRPFRRKTKSGFCVCAITFQLASNFGTRCNVRGSWLQNVKAKLLNLWQWNFPLT